MVAGGIAALAAGGVLLLGAAAATAVKIGMTVFLAGSLYVGEQALSDVRSGRVSDLDRYTRKALAGSVVGFLTGASGLLMTGASLCGVLALGFGEGLVGSIVMQKLLNEEGEIDWGVAIAEAGFSAVIAGVAWKEGRSVKGGGGSQALGGGSVPKGALTGKLDGLTTAERTMVDDLLNAGNNVEIIPRSNIPGNKTPDFLVNGVKTELKTLTGTSLSTPVTRIQDGFKQGAEAVIIDGRNTGLKLDDANTVIERALGKYGGELLGIVEIWTTEGIIGR